MNYHSLFNQLNPFTMVRKHFLASIKHSNATTSWLHKRIASIYRYFTAIFFVAILLPSSQASVTVQDALGTFTYDGKAQRIVVLDLSYADILARLNLKVVGLADDHSPERFYPEVLEKLGNYTSVGKRIQPSLEIISKLQPDLIIADSSRHTSIYEQLKLIAPTLILNSILTTYENELANAAIIAQVTNTTEQWQKALAEHQAELKELTKGFDAKGRSAIMISSKPNAIGVSSNSSFAGSMLEYFGFKTITKEMAGTNQDRFDVSLEGLNMFNPDILFIGFYMPDTIVEQWQKDKNPMWQLLKAVQTNYSFTVNNNDWIRSRGLTAAERIAQDIANTVGKQDQLNQGKK